jgi:hypothetical protein
MHIFLSKPRLMLCDVICSFDNFWGGSDWQTDWQLIYISIAVFCLWYKHVSVTATGNEVPSLAVMCPHFWRLLSFGNEKKTLSISLFRLVITTKCCTINHAGIYFIRTRGKPMLVNLCIYNSRFQCNLYLYMCYQLVIILTVYIHIS